MRALCLSRIISFCGVVIGASSSIDAQVAVPKEPSNVEARSVERFGTLLGVREIADGKVLVNDAGNRQIVLLDNRLAKVAVVVDSGAQSALSYGPIPTPIIPYIGDSTIFVDGSALALVLITPSGRPGRIFSAPIPSDFKHLSFSAAWTDAEGNLLYRTVEGRRPTDPSDFVNYMAVESQSDDSLPLVRASFATRKVDTIARLKASDFSRIEVIKRPGGIDLQPILNPLPTFDEWAVLSNGLLAIVRGRDYRVDILRSDGKVVASTNLPFDWRRVTEGEKLTLIDSLRRARAAKDAAARLELGVPTPKAEPGLEKQVVSVITSGSQPSVPDQRPVAGRETAFVNPSQMVDYYPPIRAGAAQPDRDGNVWILPTTSAQSIKGELVYDVVNSRAELVQRVRIPLGRSIAGFGPDGVVYLTGRDSNGWFIERTRITR